MAPAELRQDAWLGCGSFSSLLFGCRLRVQWLSTQTFEDWKWFIVLNCCVVLKLVTAKVALKTVAGVDVSGLSDFMKDVKNGLGEELIDRALDETTLERFLSWDEDAGANMQQDTRASFEAIKFHREGGSQVEEEGQGRRRLRKLSGCHEAG